MGTTGMAMVLRRAMVLTVLMLLRSLTSLLIFAAGFDGLAALTGGNTIHRESTGVQASEHAENQQTHQW